MRSKDRYKDPNRALADYLYGDLDPDASRTVEKAIDEDPELSQAYRWGERVTGYLKDKVQLEEMRNDPDLAEAERLAGMLVDASPEVDLKVIPEPASGAMEGDKRDNSKRKLSTKWNFRRKWMVSATAIAATAALVITLGIMGPGRNPEKIYQRYYTPLNASGYTLRGSSPDNYSLVNEGIILYLEGDFSESARIFNDLSGDPSLQLESRFFSGLSYMGLGQNEAAAEMLTWVVDQEGRYLPEALWYLSLCSVQEGDLDQAALLLQELAEYEGSYQETAQSLLKDLRRIRK